VFFARGISSPGPKKGIFFSFFPGSQCVLTMFHSSSHVFPQHVLHIACHFYPICFGKCCPPFTYIDEPKRWRNSILQNRTWYEKNVKVLKDQTVCSICSKKSIPDQVWFVLHTIVNCFRHNLKLELVALFFQEIYYKKKTHTHTHTHIYTHHLNRP